MKLEGRKAIEKHLDIFSSKHLQVDFNSIYRMMARDRFDRNVD